MDYAIETRTASAGFSDLSECLTHLKAQLHLVVEKVRARAATTDDDLMLWARQISLDDESARLEGVRHHDFGYVPTLDSLASDFEVCGPWDSVRRKVRGFEKYEHGWDGYAGVPAAADAVDDALTFLRKIPSMAPLPRPGLSGDGEVGLFWDYGKGFIDIGFLGDGKYSFYGRSKDGYEIFGDDEAVEQEIDGNLNKLILEYE